MAEKKRGLGRGLGALIPQTVTDDRPVDVFFPSNGEEATAPDKRNDPAASMRSARKVSRETSQRRTATPKDSQAEKSASTGAGAKKASSRKPAAASKSSKPGGNKPAATPKSGATSKTAESTAAAPSRRRSGSKPVSGPTTDSAREDMSGATAATPENGADTPSSAPLAPVEGTAFGEIPLSEIAVNPHQPRQVFDEEALEELVTSITEVGILQPVVVRLVSETTPRYQLIMGERRFRASTAAGMSAIPAIIRQTEDDDLLRDALLENLHRVDLNPLEEAAAYEQLLKDFGCTQEELSMRIGRSRPQISNTLRLLRLPPLVQRRVAAGVISAGHARALLSLERAGDMETLAQRIVAEGLSVRAAEEAAILLNGGQEPSTRGARQSRAGNPEMDALAAQIGDRLDTKVSIAMGRRKGKLSVEFAGEEDLSRILEALRLK